MKPPSPGTEFLQDLVHYHQNIADTRTQYTRLRRLLQRVCKDLTANDPVEFSNLFSRLNFVCNKTKLSKKKKYHVNHFRVQANRAIRYGYTPTKEEYYQDLRSLADAISHFYSVPVPSALSVRLPKQDYRQQGKRISTEIHTRIRVHVETWDDEYIYAVDEDHAAEELIKIRYNVEGINKEFNTTITELWEGCQLNLVNTKIDAAGIYFPEFIVLEPDYLIDITSLAECFKEHSNHPLQYMFSRLQTTRSNKHLLLGSTANFFLDEFINATPGQAVNYTEAIKKVFKASPLEFSTCKDLADKDGFNSFIIETRAQFANIEKTINKTFSHPDHDIKREKSVLEPAFLSELYGIQGRLDLLEASDDFSKIIELKSGKSPFPQDNHTLISINHTVQAFLYSLVIQNLLQVPYDSLRTYIFYSRCSEGNMRLSSASRSHLRSIINTRNRIVSIEKRIASDPTGIESKAFISQINKETFIGNRPGNHFLNNFIIPEINRVKDRFDNASLLESDYFHSMYAFVAREHYFAKTGEAGAESSRGLSSLWLSDYDEKLEAGEIMTDLVILTNNMSDDPPSITFGIPQQDTGVLPNFRKGDVVMLYERNLPSDNVTNKQVFKGTISSVSSKEVSIRFRYKQRNVSLFSKKSRYAVEPDIMDANFNFMYRGLFSFLGSHKDRRDLLLNQRKPSHLPAVDVKGVYDDTIQQVIYKAKAAKDYFLLIGPPGTGKTSVALRSMVEEFYAEPDQNILLLAYTNRAVDEICDAISASKDAPPFLRIGSEISCGDKHKDKLMDNVIASCHSREEVRNKIAGYRIFVGTVMSISAKMELFKLKNFPVAIIDEASQILEPQLLAILSAIDSEGKSAIGKFILIGDHKQLPAVVVQPEHDSRIKNAQLAKIGLTDRRNSLFERLYHLQKKEGNDMAWEMLQKQGRMHPEIAEFPNISFYQGQLRIAPAPHQLQELEFSNYDADNAVETLLASKRLLFIPSDVNEADLSAKMNSCEAAIVSTLVKTIYDLYRKNKLPFDPKKSLGIIAPFRNQLALIRDKIQALGIPELEGITIDTVERYQGSQRDIIIYSCTVTEKYQMNYLSHPMKEDGAIIDRKLNVALTRARKQLFITGNPSVLRNNSIYTKLMTFIRSQGGFIEGSSADFIKGEFSIIEKEAKKGKADPHKRTKARVLKSKISKAG